MIEIINAGKTYKTKAEEKVALKNINLNLYLKNIKKN